MHSRQHVALVVEDVPEQRLYISALLRKMGFQVFAVREGEAVFDLASRLIPDIICLDLVLPNVCGLEVCEALKRSPITARIPILVTSARTSPQDRANVEWGGAEGFLPKPIEPALFAKRVRELTKLQTSDV